MVVFGTRWKTKTSEAYALANPVSGIISDLQSSLVHSRTHGLLLYRIVDCVVLLEVELEQADLLDKACFGCCIVTAVKNKQQYELSLEEAFYLSSSLKCLDIVWEDKCVKNSEELWQLILSKRKLFPIIYKAYSHLRAKNWIVRSEIKYGVDYVAYRHHPSLVHSEYAVMVLSGSDGINTRLQEWPSLHATVRLEDGVAKTLLVLHIRSNSYDVLSPSCLENYTVKEQMIARWNPEQYHEDYKIVDTVTENSCDSIDDAHNSPHYHFNKFSTHQITCRNSALPAMIGSSARWKGKGSKAIALSNPMSGIITRLRSSLMQAEVCGLLSGCCVLVEVGIEQADLLNRACFGCPIIMSNKDAHWYELSLEEAFYLCHFLNCIKIVRKSQYFKNNDELWELMKSKRELFAVLYKAYSHLRAKNWVVRSGTQYGVDFVAYRHHPSLVHSEYAVVVSDGNRNTRLVQWPDVHATVRLEGGVAKTLLVLHIKRNGYDEVSASSLKQYSVEEQTVKRWSSEQCREDRKLI